MLEVAGEATTNPSAQEGETGSFSSKHEIIACFNCGEPIMDKVNHECIVETCPICSAVLAGSDKVFHKQYCRPFITFTGRRLNRIFGRTIVGCNFIMYNDSPKSIYLVLPPGTVAENMVPIYVDTWLTVSNDVMKMKMTLDSSGVQVTAKCTEWNGFSITIFDNEGNILSSVNNYGDKFEESFAVGAIGSLPDDEVLFICIFVR